MDIRDIEKIQRAKEEGEAIYKEIGEVFCPYFKEKIVFNAKGIEHLKFKRLRQARSLQDQYIRFRLLSLAPKIVTQSHTLQGISVRRNFEKEKVHSRWETIMKTVTYFEFVAVVKDVRVRVIVKQVESGQKYFWSIIPFWKMDKITGKRLLHSGVPESD